MKPIRNVSVPFSGTTVRCAVAAYGAIQATADSIPAMRQRPGPPVGEPLPTNFLKNSDEQTVVSLSAVFQAIHRHGLAGTSFQDWAVLAAPRFLGRVASALTLQRFMVEGAWGISPHIIPHRSLHTLSGTISQAFGIHGPNLGVGGGKTAATEVMLAAAAMVSRNCLPGVWVVVSGWNPELYPELPGPENCSPRASANCLQTACICGAAVLALTNAPSNWEGLVLDVHVGALEEPGGTSRPVLTVESLLGVLNGTSSLPAGTWSLGHGGWLEMKKAGAGAEAKL